MRIRGRYLWIAGAVFVAALGCERYAATEPGSPGPERPAADVASDTTLGLKEIFLAGGSFWATEELLSRVPGVVDTEPGYANSRVASPTFAQVDAGTTGAAMAVHVVYDPRRVPLPWLLELYYRSIDPLAVNAQGYDTGPQYRTGIWWEDPADSLAVMASLRGLQRRLGAAPAIAYGRIGNFYDAEEYHRNYLRRFPSAPCRLSAGLLDTASRGAAVQFADLQPSVPSDSVAGPSVP